MINPISFGKSIASPQPHEGGVANAQSSVSWLLRQLAEMRGSVGHFENINSYLKVEF
ncbi:MAG TPA: hypothetical protein VFC92_09655 [Bacteroidales bacterium]|nr:hypothetical protein [Bacteroidales bacterium]